MRNNNNSSCHSSPGDFGCPATLGFDSMGRQFLPSTNLVRISMNSSDAKDQNIFGPITKVDSPIT